VDGTKSYICVAREEVTNGYTSDNSDSTSLTVLCRYISICVVSYSSKLNYKSNVLVQWFSKDMFMSVRRK